MNKDILPDSDFLEKQTSDCLTVLEKHGITTKLFGNVKAAVTPKFKGFT